MNIYNNEHYPDPTAQTAIDNAQHSQEDAERRLTQLINVIKPIITWAGFELMETKHGKTAGGVRR